MKTTIRTATALFRTAAVAALLCAGAVTAVPQEADDDQGAISNLNWKLEGEDILITYDLSGPAEDRVEIGVAMMRENLPSFRLVPESVEGDIGEGVAPGPGRQIVWHFKKDYPAGFQGEGYYIEARIQPRRGDNRWLYYAVGAAAVVGGVAAILIGNSQADNAPRELPFPPGRP